MKLTNKATQNQIALSKSTAEMLYFLTPQPHRNCAAAFYITLRVNSTAPFFLSVCYK